MTSLAMPIGITACFRRDKPRKPDGGQRGKGVSSADTENCWESPGILFERLLGMNPAYSGRFRQNLISKETREFRKRTQYGLAVKREKPQSATARRALAEKCQVLALELLGK